MTRNSILTRGKHKFKTIQNVPIDYLLNIYNSQQNAYPELLAYVNANIDDIKNGINPERDYNVTCTKIKYCNKKIANQHLKRIRSKTQEHKKPIRAYECEKCSQWHLTSKELLK